MLAIAASPCLIGSARAEDKSDRYPNRPIHLILPSTIGGTSDLLARVIADRVGDALGQSIVIEARAGASGQIAVAHVAVAAADGYTLLLANNGANAIDKARREASRVDLQTALAPVTMLARLPIVVAVSPGLGVSTLSGLIARARKAPGSLSYASGGVGSTSHMAAVLLFHRAGVRLLHIPYPGTSAAVKDVLSGEVPILFTHLGTVAALVRAGRLRALAVTSQQRMPDFLDVPTVAESGYPGFDITTWHGIVAPANTPRPVIRRLQDAFARAVAVPDVRRQLVGMGMEPVTTTPEQFARIIAADIRKWQEVIHAMGRTTE